MSSADVALMDAERKRLRKERDAATNALHGLRRRLESLQAELAEARERIDQLRELAKESDDWQQGLLEDHWDALEDQRREEE